MHIHILGVCGTFMAGLARIAKQLGHEVTGSDAAVYPPMSTQLNALGITLSEGYDTAAIEPVPDLVIMGNAMKRGMPVVEWVLNSAIPYVSGPEWLFDEVLRDKRVIAIAGTHGKTTTTAMTVWILEQAGLNPSFLVGGVLANFEVSARLTDSEWFVIEADEYDTAFFDKRPKFLHYRPEVCLINNIEFDHADIYDNLDAIKKQFAYLLRQIPSKGLLVHPLNNDNACDIAKQSYSPVQTIGGNWSYCLDKGCGSQFTLTHESDTVAVNWSLLGEHNVANGVAAIALAHAAGVKLSLAATALERFTNVKRRLELIAKNQEVYLYDDFAHHPTAIKTTLNGLRQHIGDAKLIACIELASYTMRAGVHTEALISALKNATVVYVLTPEDKRLRDTLVAMGQGRFKLIDTVDEMAASLQQQISSPCHIVLMSNRSFGGLHQLMRRRIVDLSSHA